MSCSLNPTTNSETMNPEFYKPIGMFLMKDKTIKRIKLVQIVETISELVV